MKNKKIRKILLIALIIIIFAVGIVVGRMTGNSNKMKNFDKMNSESDTTEEEVGTQTIENTLTSAGEIAAGSTEQLDLTTTYYFKTMCVETGDIVQAGGNILEYTNGTYLTASYTCLISDYSVPDSGSICTSSNYVEVQNVDTMTMNLTVSESDINSIAVGQEVEIEISALDDATYTGTIKSVSGLGTYSTSGTTFTAVVEFANDGNVKVGMSASCSIILEKAEDCIAVPIEAVQTSGDQKYVIKVNDDGTTENVNIETGISDDSYVQVISGLSGGEKIQMQNTKSSNKENGDFDMGERGESFEGMPSGDMQMPGGGMPGQNE